MSAAIVAISKLAAVKTSPIAQATPPVTEKIHQRVVGLARREGVAEGRKLRTDTTAVEINVRRCVVCVGVGVDDARIKYEILPARARTACG
jgi:hypothetical protein